MTRRSPMEFDNLSGLALTIARREGSVTSDDIRDYTTKSMSRNILGAVFSNLLKIGYLTHAGIVRTKVSSSRSRWIFKYVLTDRGNKVLR